MVGSGSGSITDDEAINACEKGGSRDEQNSQKGSGVRLGDKTESLVEGEADGGAKRRRIIGKTLPEALYRSIARQPDPIASEESSPGRSDPHKCDEDGAKRMHDKENEGEAKEVDEERMEQGKRRKTNEGEASSSTSNPLVHVDSNVVQNDIPSVLEPLPPVALSPPSPSLPQTLSCQSLLVESGYNSKSVQLEPEIEEMPDTASNPVPAPSESVNENGGGLTTKQKRKIEEKKEEASYTPPSHFSF
jgi:hypothetical protein